MMNTQQIKFGINFRVTNYAYGEIDNFIQCVEGVGTVDLEERYTTFLNNLLSRKIKPSTLVDKDVLEVFQEDLANRANIDHENGHHDDDPEIMRGGKRFYVLANQLKSHLEKGI